MKMTDKEQQVVTYMEKFDNKGWFDQEGWFFPEDMRVEGLSQHALGGVLSSLEKKSIVTFESDGMVILTKVWRLNSLLPRKERKNDQRNQPITKRDSNTTRKNS